MDSQTMITLAVILVGFGGLVYFFKQQLQQMMHRQDADKEQMKLMKEWVESMMEETKQTRKEMQDRLDHSNKGINERLDNAAKVIGNVSKSMQDVNKAIGEMSEIGRHMQGLQEFLRSPKLRGNLGEQILKDMLEQTIPHDNFALQHTFRNGTIVDAAVKTDRGIIPIDSKFPMENFRKMVSLENEAEKDRARKDFINDVRKHIRAIATKYILPEEGTLDFALMYVPSESVAYEIVVNTPEVLEYAHENRIVVVSPNQFNHYLKVILIGLEGKKIEERAQMIMRSIRAIEQDTNRFGEDFRVLLTHLSNAKSKADSAQTSFNNLTAKIENMHMLGESVTEELPEQLPMESKSEEPF
ncbi:DNA recombination protein RmuC [candidate division WWE3 bacterium]|uniref:DNA recombination protein RmuC n=1 Tax=candidate division WWE3 bacterium TaxID=2053526 RepID=A0A955LGY5_UNCKA|nr:DNA recombination protein RmuC [candidate division WWE3 bacterium]